MANQRAPPLATIVFLNLVLTGCYLSVYGQASKFRELGSIEVKTPAFVSVHTDPRPPQGEVGHNWTLLLSSFSGNPFAKDGVYFARNVQESVFTSVADIKLTEMSNEVVWPNECRLVPSNVFPGSDISSVATGFLVPGKTKGTISLFDMSTNPVSGPHVITATSTNFFYHRVMWHDMNGDGRMDALTARAEKPLIGATKTSLLWLEHPPSNALSSIWQEHVLLEGPDVFFILVHLPMESGELAPFIISSNFFTKELELIWPDVNSSTGQVDWSPLSLKSRVIDEVDAAFDVRAIDVDSDGRLEVVVSANNEQSGSLIIYAIPHNLTNPEVKWPKHIIATGYRPIKAGVGKGAPGAMFPVCLPDGVLRPNGTCSRSESGDVIYPSIVLSGDDDGHVYLLSPTSTPWNYTQEVLLTAQGTVGQLSVVSINKPNSYQVFVPDYDGNKIHILTT